MDNEFTYIATFTYVCEYCIAVVTVAGRDDPVRNSVLPAHLADLPNFIGLSSR